MSDLMLLRRLEDIPQDHRGGALSIGNFDGVHRGHQLIVRQLVERARQLKGTAIVLTFDPHPAAILYPQRVPPALSWLELKADLLAQSGVQLVVACATDRQLLSLEYDQFFASVVRRKFAPQAMVEGTNFCFGRDRRGDIQALQSLCEGAGIGLDVVQPASDSGSVISSSRIRLLLAGGDVAAANRMLQRPYRLRGRVVRGAGRGVSLGFPTANLEEIDTLVPGHGVYAGRAQLGDRALAAAIHVGPVPTFDDPKSKVEVHLIGFEGSLYGTVIEVDFLRRLRDVVPFDTHQSLRTQIELDVLQANQAHGAQLESEDANGGPDSNQRDPVPKGRAASPTGANRASQNLD